MSLVRPRTTSMEASDVTNKRQKTPSPQPESEVTKATSVQTQDSTPLKPRGADVAAEDVPSANTITNSALRLAAQFENCTFETIDALWNAFLKVGCPTAEREVELAKQKDGEWTKEAILEPEWSTEEGFLEGTKYICTSSKIPNPFRTSYRTALESRSGATRLPDIILLHPEIQASQQPNPAKPTRHHWSHVAMTVQVKASQTHREARDQIFRDWEQIYGNQSGRRFVLGLTVWKDEVRFHVGGSFGCLSTPAFNRREKPFFLASVIRQLALLRGDDYGLWTAFCPADQLGQPTFDFKLPLVGGGVLAGRVKGSIFHRKEVVGRGARVYNVDLEHSGLQDDHGVACKLSYQDRGRTVEKEVLAVIDRERRKSAKAENFGGLPRLACPDAVIVEPPTLKDILGVTGWESVEKEMGEAKKEGRRFFDLALIDRVLSVTMSGPATVTLCSARSAKQLVGAVIDAVKAHRQLFEIGYLHRDISFSNILLGPNWRSPKWEDDALSGQRGILNDFDMAKKDGDQAHKERTGTYPFIALHLLAHPHTPHTVSHDLESFIYVVFWIATLYDTTKPGSGSGYKKAGKGSVGQRGRGAVGGGASHQGGASSSCHLAPPQSIVASSNASKRKYSKFTQNGSLYHVRHWVNDPAGARKMVCFTSTPGMKELIKQIQPCWATLRTSSLLLELGDLVNSANVRSLSRQPITYGALLKTLEKAYPSL